MENINLSIVYTRKNKLNQKGEALVYIRVNCQNKNKYFSTGKSQHLVKLGMQNVKCRIKGLNFNILPKLRTKYQNIDNQGLSKF